MERLDVLYTVNNKYVDVMLASILSLIENGKVNIRLHIITSDFTKEDYYKIANILSANIITQFSSKNSPICSMSLSILFIFFHSFK